MAKSIAPHRHPPDDDFKEKKVNKSNAKEGWKVVAKNKNNERKLGALYCRWPIKSFSISLLDYVCE